MVAMVKGENPKKNEPWEGTDSSPRVWKTRQILTRFFSQESSTLTFDFLLRKISLDLQNAKFFVRGQMWAKTGRKN